MHCSLHANFTKLFQEYTVSKHGARLHVQSKGAEGKAAFEQCSSLIGASSSYLFPLVTREVLEEDNQAASSEVSPNSNREDIYPLSVNSWSCSREAGTWNLCGTIFHPPWCR